MTAPLVCASISHMNRTYKALIESVVLATVITAGLMIAQNVLTQNASPINWWEVSAVWTSFSCTWLCTKQVRFNYVLGIISTILLAITFWQAHLYGSMALNLYLIPTVIYGWFIWGKDTNTKPVLHVTPKAAWGYAIATVLTWAGANWAILHFGGSMSILDSFNLVGSILAQWLLDRKKLENWIIWAAVNVVSIYVYWSQGLFLLSVQFAFFLANAVYAWFVWHKTMQPTEMLDMA